ncbi:MAG: alanine--tRNA ligase, partial [Candidatus Babeliales bacterium]
MKSTEIRQLFFDFFINHGHEEVASSSLIPAQDPTLLFANAGMNQFKDIFLGKEKRHYSRAVSIQKCVRAGGKHNDLDNVGFTQRHLTFFEMMGNFSFGDYFKKEAIIYAWEFLTKKMNLPAEQLYAAVYEEDDESFNIWHTIIGLPKEKIYRLGAEHNFWQMADLGPCGPCTEIFIDRGSAFKCPGEITGSEDIKSSCGPACDCDRFLEIWNLVFMQYDRQADGSLKPLAQTGVDTGMGLERLCAITQNKNSVFETDLFHGIIKKIEELSGKLYVQQPPPLKAACNVLADHIRSATFIIADGCAPSNEGRGYVLRKIIRRAALFAQKLTDKNIFPSLSQVVVKEMGTIYPELTVNEQLIFDILTSEIKKFSVNLERGNIILEKYFQKGEQQKLITAQQAFKLYDTYGFPIELVIAAAKERGYKVNIKGFEEEMKKQRAQSGQKYTDPLDHLDLDAVISTEFTGYQELETETEIIALIHDNKLVSTVSKGEPCWVITKKSPFFIVGGGQVPDEGWLVINKFKIPHTGVRFINSAIATHIIAPMDLQIDDKLTAIVNEQLRINAMKNHTATHLLQAALMQLFGKQIKQSGSFVHPDYLRFDFTYHKNLTKDDIAKIENLVNAKIRENIPVTIEYTDLNDALSRGVIAFFGDKYKPEKVRIVGINNFSAELCGGTHVVATGDIGTFKITDVTSPSAGHRRIVAVTGQKAIELFQNTFDTVKQLSHEFKTKSNEIIEQVLKQKEEIKQLQTTTKKLKQQLWQTKLPQWEKEIEMLNNIPFLFLEFEQATSEELRDIAHALTQKKPGFYFLISKTNTNRLLFYSIIGEKFTSIINIKNFGQWLKETFNLRGGSRDNALQG